MSKYPIQRLIVYPSYPGKTVIYWDLHPNMQDPLPYTYQLQRCLSANPDDDWKNIGGEQDNAIALVDSLEDPNSIRTGYLLDCYYRIVLKTPRGTYVSEPEGCFGQLHRDEWKTALEILSKERLLFKKTAVPGVLLQAIRNGDRCPYCNGEYSSGVFNSQCEHCFGTGYLNGYHKPFHFQAWQVTPSQKHEIHYNENVATMNMSVDRYQARAEGVPEIYNGDIWIDLSTAQRFRITASKVIAQIRRVPLVREIDMSLIPATDIAYKIPIGNDNYSSVKVFEVKGCGDTILNHDFGEPNGLQYVEKQTGKPISGAKITVKSLEGKEVHTTTTNASGQWVESYKAPIGTYDITFKKEGVYGPDYARVVIAYEDLSEQEKKEYSAKQNQQNINYFTSFEV